MEQEEIRSEYIKCYPGFPTSEVPEKAWHYMKWVEDKLFAVDTELTSLRRRAKEEGEELTTLCAKVERLAKRNELLEEWRKMDESGLTAKVEEMGMRVNKRHDILAERKRIAQAVRNKMSGIENFDKWRNLSDRIERGDFAKEDKP